MRVDGSQIRVRRRARGLSQERVAEIAGVSVRTVRSAELGERTPFGFTVQLIAKALECRVEDLLVDASGVSSSADARRGPSADGAFPRERGASASTASGAPTSATRARLRVGSVPPRTHSVVGREADLEIVRKRLLGSPGRMLVIHGWPGVGKTTLSLLAAHDAALESAFVDGALWCSVGQSPDVGGELRAWARSLGLGEQDILSLNTEQLSSRLASLLRDRRILLVIDDVWSAAAAKPLCVGGPGSATLVTTRISALADDLGGAGATYRLGVLDRSSSVRLLEGIVPETVARFEGECEELVDTLEGLPLALHVAGRLLRREERAGFTVTDLLRDLRRDARPVHCADLPADLAAGPGQSVATLLARSTNLLDPTTRERFAMLAVVVPKPAVFSEDMAAAAWGTSDARPTLRELSDRGLIEFVGAGDYQIHALLAVHAHALLEAL